MSMGDNCSALLIAERSCRASSMISCELLNGGERVKTVEEPLVEYVKTWGSCCLYHSGICVYKQFLHSFWPGTNIIADLYFSYISPVITTKFFFTREWCLTNGSVHHFSWMVKRRIRFSKCPRQNLSASGLIWFSWTRSASSKSSIHNKYPAEHLESPNTKQQLPPPLESAFEIGKKVINTWWRIINRAILWFKLGLELTTQPQ